MDVQSRSRWEQYTTAKEEMLRRTHIPDAPWWVVEAVDKKRARLNCISHLLQQIPYGDIERDPVVLPDRIHDPSYRREKIAKDMYVPQLF
jgi:lysozyme family protein